jgi:hypothetical protein
MLSDDYPTSTTVITIHASSLKQSQFGEALSDGDQRLFDILNTHTKKLHRSCEEGSRKITDCGALAHVSQEHVQRVSDQEIPTLETARRCGRCFPGEGGY